MKKILVLAAGILLTAANLYAGNGDLIVNGNLGVGTASPLRRLHVDGELSLSRSDKIGFINVSDSNGNGGGTIWLRGLDQNGNAGIDATILMSGKVGIGTTSPANPLSVNGSAYIINGSLGFNRNPTDGSLPPGGNASGGRYQISNLSDRLQFEAYNSSGISTGVIVIRASDGNVGIGTTPDPGYKLTVAGSALTFNGIWQNSDIRLKKNILPVEGALDKILKLNGVSYEWKHGKDFEGETLEALKTDEDGKIKSDKYRDLPEERTLGIIAQELENVLPEAVNTDADGIKAVSYTKIIPVLIEAMKEQQKQITEQQKQVAAQLDKINDQQKRIEELEKKVSQLK